VRHPGPWVRLTRARLRVVRALGGITLGAEQGELGAELVVVPEMHNSATNLHNSRDQPTSASTTRP
jgi:hypothetical protein